MLQNKSLVVTLNISTWTGRKHDKKISREIESSHQAHNAGKYNKVLAAKDYLKEVQKKAGEARSFHYENTLPWGDQGERLLPAKNYFEYTRRMATLKGEFERAAKSFIDDYPKVIEDAKYRLNGMFDPADYPPQTTLVEKFSIKTGFFPIPEDDFRLDIGTGENEKLKAELKEAISERLNAAVKDTWKRIGEVVRAVSERLNDQDAIFRDSLFTNVKDLANLLPKLNITDDPDIKDVCGELNKLFTQPEAVRGSSRIRKDKAAQADDIINKFNTFFAA